ncbi:sterol C-5 desaturase [Tribonema minus]|uniref:Sterol C-5 desaturase n=1 Tax=Tribonema minus TaxID=303371 RepID=A0A835YRT7_9STRA|nr:sterol C-5 desaturase [Tribonema minus]
MASSLSLPQKAVAFLVATGVAGTAARTISLHAARVAETDGANPYKEFNQWVNSYIIPEAWTAAADEALGPYAAHFVVMYFRDLVAGSIMYYTVSGLWHLYIYHLKRDKFFPDGQLLPTRETIVDQIMLAQASLFMYAGLPVLSEWLIEEGYTRAYYSISEVGGWPQYVALTLLYLTLVEIGIYWMHRKLHTNKILYKYVHALHHKYNKAQTLTPWCSVAFNPLDGILQACPYVIMLFVVPCHYLTHVVMLFFTAVWATNIHDALDGDTEPIMGSKYHTMHHTHYHVNFGQFFVFCDWFWGTLRDPKAKPSSAQLKKAA